MQLIDMIMAGWSLALGICTITMIAFIVGLIMGKL